MRELLVCADLIALGYHVFRSVTPNNECDLVALAKGVPMKIEVTTGIVYNGMLSHPHKDRSKSDVLAIVDYRGKITYMPIIPRVT